MYLNYIRIQKYIDFMNYPNIICNLSVYNDAEKCIFHTNSMFH